LFHASGFTDLETLEDMDADHDWAELMAELFSECCEKQCK